MSDLSRDAHMTYGMMWAAYETAEEPVTPEQINAFADWGDDYVEECIEDLVEAGKAKKVGDGYVPV